MILRQGHAGDFLRGSRRSSARVSKKEKRVPFAQQLPRGGKTASAAYGTLPKEDTRPVWRFGIVDLEGPYGWAVATSPDLRAVLSSLRSFETMRWSEIEGKRHHFIAKSQPSKPSRDRLVAIKQDDIDQVFSLALGGLPRVIGIRDRWMFKILWWDPHHEVCPSTKKHT